MRRFTHVHPSGLPLARHPRMERERLRLPPQASHSAVTHDARQGGDGPTDTGPDHVLTNRPPTGVITHNVRPHVARLPPASPHRYDGRAMDGLSPPFRMISASWRTA